MKTDILAFGVHPDDVELGCGGTLIKEVKRGKKVAVVDLTRGELGSNGTPELRLEEAEAAAAIMGVHDRMNLHMEDGWFEINQQNKRKVIQAIRHYKPEIVICNAISDRHPDHGRSSQLVSEACFLAGLSRIETEMNGQEQEKWRPKAVYHYIQAYHHEPDVVVNITEEFEQKMEAVLAYRSQFHVANDIKQENTYIASPEFLEYVKGRNSHFAAPIGRRYAEGFNVERYVGCESLLDLV